jgi:hypothetical protein
VFAAFVEALTRVMEGVAIPGGMGRRAHAEMTLACRVSAALVIASQSYACGGSSRTGPDLPAAGSPSDNGGAGGSEPAGPAGPAGSGGLPSSGGGPAVGGSTASEGGTGVVAGTAGAAGGTAGAAGGSGGAAQEPNKIVLFDGSSDSFQREWASVRNGNVNPWKYNADGTMTVTGGTGDIRSKQKFRDVFVHLEYLTQKVTLSSSVHERSNSGVLLNGSYELQIIDSSVLEPAIMTCGAVYGVVGPLEIACHEAGVWNTYEIEFQAPTCEGGPTTVKTPARFVEVKLNGTLIHRAVDVLRETQAGQRQSCEPQGLLLQDWASILPASFRNIWVIPRD